MLGHGIAVDQPGHGENSGLSETRTAQIGDQGRSPGQLTAPAQQADRITFLEMVQHKIAEHDIVEGSFGKIEEVRTDVTDLGETVGKLFRNLQGRLLTVHRGNHEGTAHFPRALDQGARNVTGPGAQVEHAQRLTPLEHRPEVIEHQPVRTETAVE